MYYCEDCEHFFEVPDKESIFVGYKKVPMYEICPYCESTNYSFKDDPE